MPNFKSYKINDCLSEESFGSLIKVESESSFNVLPPVIQKAILKQKRIVMIANNPSIDKHLLKAVLQPTDILILFNNFIHADYFISNVVTRALPKLLFFRQYSDSPIHFGMPPNPNKISAISKMSKTAPLGMLFSNVPYQFSKKVNKSKLMNALMKVDKRLYVPTVVRDLICSDDHCRILSDSNNIVSDYPCYSNIKFSSPSSGFLVYRLLLSARLHISSLQPEKSLLPIVMIGFNNEDDKSGFWTGHNWDFERQELAMSPDSVVCL